MSDTIIRVENVSKLYRLGEVGTGTISHDLNRWWHRVRGKEDPYLKIGQTNDRTKKGDSEYSWALKDVSFEVKRGEVLGIIGRNGAGKSTLLKILSRVTTPTSGEIKVKGRIASLLEVGTGFNPELTGRDNIYLNGAILGMRTREIAQKFDEIVAFAEVDRYIDTPVKRYSSGMYVRLAFAVAAHLEPEILIVDEVLAVGDAAFQKKCLGKMGEVAREGRTVLFVSHTMTAVKTLTNRVILMDQGNIAVNSHPDEAISKYLEMSSDNSNDYFITKSEGTHTNVTKLSMLDQKGKNTDFYIPGTKFIFEIHFTTDGTQQMSLELFLADSKKNRIAFASPAHFNEVFLPTKAGKYVCRMELHSIFLASGSYCVDVATALSNKAWDHQIERAITFIVPFSNPNNLSWDFKQTYGYGVFAWVQSKESEISFTKVI